MPVKLTDDETAMLVMARKLLTPEQLAPFRAPGAGAPGTLFERLAAAGLLPPQFVAELEHGAADASPAPASAPVPAPLPPGSQGSAILSRRVVRAHSFEDAPAAPPRPVSAAAMAAPPAPPAAAQRASHVTAVLGPAAAVASRPAAHSAVAPAAEAAPPLPEGWPGGLAPADPSPGHVQQYLARAKALGASDLYIAAGAAPTLMLHGELRPIEGLPVLSAAQSGTLIRQTMTPAQWAYLEHTGGLCFAYTYQGGGRYRASAFRHRGGCDATFRIIPEHVPPLEQLGLPEGVNRLTQFTDGMVLLASPAGGGKTTTMMALLSALAQARRAHVVTLEEPLEHLLLSSASQITQREVGSHTESVAAGIHAALRGDAELIAIGELRDNEAIHAALSAAEAGLLVFATVQAPECACAIDRILECPTEPQQRRNMAADNLRAVFSQQLIRRAGGQGRAVACELLLNSISVGNIIREAKTQNLVNVMQTGKQQGMIMFDDTLRTLLEAKAISGEEAYMHARNKGPFKQHAPKPEQAEPDTSQAPEREKAPPGRK